MIFEIPGEPKGKARARTVRNSKTGRSMSFTPQETVEYENLVKFAFMKEYPKFEPITHSVKMEITAYYGMPKTMPKRDIKAVQENRLFPSKKPDADNIAKIIADSLNGICYRDDSQIAELTVHKRYSMQPRVKVYVDRIV